MFAVFGLTVGFAAFLIPENDRSVKLVAARVIACALGGGLLFTALTLGYAFTTSMAVGAGVALAVTPLAVALTQIQQWAASIRENSMLRGFRRTALATTFLAVVALCPWELLGEPPFRSASQGLALMLVITVAAPALIIALHTALVARGVRVIDDLFGLTPASPWHAAQRAGLVFDLGAGKTARVKRQSAHPYRGPADAAAITLGCCGDAERACAMLSSLSAAATAVAAIALLHAAMLGLG